MDRASPAGQDRGVDPKQELLLSVLSRSWAFLQLDGRVAGVELPEWLRGPSVTLQIGYDMPRPIPDLTIDEHGVRATLSFQRTPFRCVIPWRAIYAIADLDGKGALFPGDAPADLPAPPARGDEAGPKPSPPSRTLASAPRPAPAPRPAAAVATDPGEPTDGGEHAPTDPAPDRFKSGRPRPSHLKLV